jgi:hypothetical protein
MTVPSLLDAAQAVPNSPAIPKALRLASMLVHIRELPDAANLVSGKNDYAIVQEIASQLDKRAEERQKFENVIAALHSWTELQDADTRTRIIVKTAAKHLNIAPSPFPDFFISIYERGRTIFMALKGLPERDRKQGINEILGYEKSICTTKENKKTPPILNAGIQENLKNRIINVMEGVFHMSHFEAVQKTLKY